MLTQPPRSHAQPPRSHALLLFSPRAWLSLVWTCAHPTTKVTCPTTKVTRPVTFLPQSLVEFGLDVCSPNHQGHTPCYYADFGNHRHSAGYLVVVETCAQLALEHVTETVKHERLQYSADTSKHFIKEVSLV